MTLPCLPGTGTGDSSTHAHARMQSVTEPGEADRQTQCTVGFVCQQECVVLCTLVPAASHSYRSPGPALCECVCAHKVQLLLRECWQGRAEGGREARLECSPRSEWHS